MKKKKSVVVDRQDGHTDGRMDMHPKYQKHSGIMAMSSAQANTIQIFFIKTFRLQRNYPISQIYETAGGNTSSHQ